MAANGPAILDILLGDALKQVRRGRLIQGHIGLIPTISSRPRTWTEPEVGGHAYLALTLTRAAPDSDVLSFQTVMRIQSYPSPATNSHFGGQPFAGNSSSERICHPALEIESSTPRCYRRYPNYLSTITFHLARPEAESLSSLADPARRPC
jgi:hypothetical protein